MPEYFEITLIISNQKQTQIIAECLLKQFNVKEGKNSTQQSCYAFLTHKEIIVSVYRQSENDFDEIYISISEQVFHPVTFEKELKHLSDVVGACFKCSPSIVFALCGYEINSYLLGTITRIKQMDKNFLSEFPIVYVGQATGGLILEINHNAQDIFASFDAIKFE